LNFLRSQSKTARCSSCPARRTCDRSHIAGGFTLVMFLAPWLQVEQSARRFDSSSLPPMFLSTICPIWRRTLRPVAGSISPGVSPHIWHVNPFRSKTSARSFAEILLEKTTGDFPVGASFSMYWPGFSPALSLCVRIAQPSS